MNFIFLKIPVTFHPSFWLFLLLIAFQSGYPSLEILIILGIISFSLLFHEYGHALTALYFGQNPEIHLVAFGGYASYKSYGLSEKQQFLITLNGPVFTGLLISLSYFLLKSHLFSGYYINYSLYYVMKLNMFWLVVNLIPLYPFDGGQLLRSLLIAKLGDENGLKISLIIGNICAILGSTYFLCNQYYYFGALFLFEGFKNLQTYYQSGFGRTKSNNFSLYNKGIQAMENNEPENAKAIFKKLIKSKDSYIKNFATEGLATVLDKEGKRKEAYHLLLKSDLDSLKRGKCLLCKLAFDEKNYSIIDTYSREIYGINPSFETALLISKAYACLNNPELSGGWLRTASMFPTVPNDSLKSLLEDKTFDPIRENEVFQQCTQGMINPAVK